MGSNKKSTCVLFFIALCKLGTITHTILFHCTSPKICIAFLTWACSAIMLTSPSNRAPIFDLKRGGARPEFL